MSRSPFYQFVVYYDSITVIWKRGNALYLYHNCIIIVEIILDNNEGIMYFIFVKNIVGYVIFIINNFECDM